MSQRHLLENEFQRTVKTVDGSTRVVINHNRRHAGRCQWSQILIHLDRIGGPVMELMAVPRQTSVSKPLVHRSIAGCHPNPVKPSIAGPGQGRQTIAPLLARGLPQERCHQDRRVARSNLGQPRIDQRPILKGSDIIEVLPTVPIIAVTSELLHQQRNQVA